MFVLSSCENLNDIGSIDTDYSVFINLTVNQDKQEFYVYRTLPLDSAIHGYPFGSNDEFFVDNPYIAFIDEKGNTFDSFSLQIRQPIVTPHGNYYPTDAKYIANIAEFDVKPNCEYRMIIEIDNSLVESTVKTLKKINTFKIEFGPEEPFEDRTRTLYNLSWENVPQSKYYILKRDHYRMLQSVWDSTHFVDSIEREDFIFADQTNYSKEFFLSFQYDSLRITLTAFDDNIYKHFFEKNDQVNVKNAYGYAGSSSVIDTLIRFD